jgi:hypothetical protein
MGTEAMKYLLVTGTSAEEVERLTGLRGRDTPHGTLVEKPPPFDLDAYMERLNRHLNPSRCTCGSRAMIHQPNCPMWLVMT